MGTVVGLVASLVAKAEEKRKIKSYGEINHDTARAVTNEESGTEIIH